MSFYSNVTEQDMINLRNLAEQQKNQRALKIKNRILKQTHDVKLAESLSPITKKLDVINESTKKLGEIVEEVNQQSPAIENTAISQSLRDTLAFMKENNNFFKLKQENNGTVYWNKVLIEPVRENTIKINGKEYDVSPSIQKYFTKTRYTTKSLNNNDKEIVYNILKDVGFYNMRHNKGMKSARMQDAIKDLPKAIHKIRNPPLPEIENVEDLAGEGVKIIIPSNIIDIYSRLEVLLGLKLSGHTDTLTEASNLIDELYRRGEIQNKQQYRNALNKFNTN